MEDVPGKQSGNSYVSHTSLTLLTVVLFLLSLGSFLFLYHLRQEDGFVVRSGSESKRSDSGRSGGEEDRSGELSDGAGRSPDETEAESAFSVRRRESGQYEFRLNERFDELEPGSKVTVSLYWQSQRIERYQKQVVIDSERRVDLRLKPGGRRKNIPPGVYRMRCTGNDFIRKPLIVQQVSEFLSNEERGQFDLMFQDAPPAVEYAVAVGSREEARDFQKKFLCELKKRGRTLIGAWKAWHKMARSAYEKGQDRKRIAKKLLHRFLNVERAVKRVKNWIQKQERSYVILPNSTLRGELLKLSYVLSKKVNAMSMTVLRQVGVSPFLWPAPYVERGFAPNINVLLHMEQYDRETIQGVQKAIDQSRVESSYFSLERYGVERLRELVRLTNRLKKLTSPPHIQFLRFHLSNDRKRAGQEFRTMFEYVRQLVQLRQKGLANIINGYSGEARTSFRKALELIPQMVSQRLMDVKKQLIPAVSGTLNKTVKDGNGTGVDMGKLKRYVRRVRERIPDHSARVKNCQ